MQHILDDGLRYAKFWTVTSNIFFELLTHDCLMCSTVSSDVCGLPVDFCIPTLPVFLNWVIHWVIDLSVGASVLYGCQKLCWMGITDLNLACHSMHWALCWAKCHLTDWARAHNVNTTVQLIKHFNNHCDTSKIKLGEFLHIPIQMSWLHVLN